MNTKYNKITGFADAKEVLKAAPSKVQNLSIPSDIPHGDMPGDKVEIGEGHISKARTVFPLLCKELEKVFAENPYNRRW